ncbi:MAG: type II toxin-antitoxin system VapC family toxin [Candidatus Solibacter usitatus]|nr:type II toxin-antitoxin system VapC family toxin [Candidatus Solibacter usitatus]
MAVFLDTSALAKLYHQEPGTSALESRLAAEPVAFVSRIGVVEMHSVLAGMVRAKELDPAAMELLRRRFRSDARNNKFRVTTLRESHYQKAEELLVTHGSRGLRALDALQLAVALNLFEHQLIDTFIAADRILCHVAPLAGLKTFNPEA